MSRVLTAALLLSMFTSGCAVRQTYRLVAQGSGRVLIPPGVSKPDVGQRTFTADIAAGHGSCALAEGAVTIQSRHGHVRVTVTRDPLLKQPAGWLSAWTAQAESQGCITAGEGLKLAARIVESLPLDPRAAWRLLHRPANGLCRSRRRDQAPGGQPDSARGSPARCADCGCVQPHW